MDAAWENTLTFRGTEDSDHNKHILSHKGIKIVTEGFKWKSAYKAV